MRINWIRIVAILTSFPLGILFCYILSKFLYDQPVNDVRTVTMYGSIIYLVIGVPLYIGLFDALTLKVTPSSFPMIYFAFVVLIGLLLTVIFVLLWGGHLSQILSAESILFMALYIVTGLVFGSVCLLEKKLYNDN